VRPMRPMHAAFASPVCGSDGSMILNHQSKRLPSE
jgi:hypothetical protein